MPCLGGFAPCFHDPLNKGLRITIGYKVGLCMMILGGCTTRLVNDVGGSVIHVFYHTTFDVLRMMSVSSAVLSPIQLGISVKGSEEALSKHTQIYHYQNRPRRPESHGETDIKKAFNSVPHDYVLQTCQDCTPEIAKLGILAYNKPLSVIAFGHTISSSTGIQLCDPIGPLL